MFMANILNEIRSLFPCLALLYMCVPRRTLPLPRPITQSNQPLYTTSKAANSHNKHHPRPQQTKTPHNGFKIQKI